MGLLRACPPETPCSWGPDFPTPLARYSPAWRQGKSCGWVNYAAPHSLRIVKGEWLSLFCSGLPSFGNLGCDMSSAEQGLDNVLLPGQRCFSRPRLTAGAAQLARSIRLQDDVRPLRLLERCRHRFLFRLGFWLEAWTSAV